MICQCCNVDGLNDVPCEMERCVAYLESRVDVLERAAKLVTESTALDIHWNRVDLLRKVLAGSDSVSELPKEKRIQVHGQFDDGQGHLCWEHSEKEFAALQPFMCEECGTQFFTRDDLIDAATEVQRPRPRTSEARIERCGCVCSSCLNMPAQHPLCSHECDLARREAFAVIGPALSNKGVEAHEKAQAVIVEARTKEASPERMVVEEMVGRRTNEARSCTNCDDGTASMCPACVKEQIEIALDHYITDDGKAHCHGCVIEAKAVSRCPGVLCPETARRDPVGRIRVHLGAAENMRDSQRDEGLRRLGDAKVEALRALLSDLETESTR